MEKKTVSPAPSYGSVDGRRLFQVFRLETRISCNGLRKKTEKKGETRHHAMFMRHQ